MENDLVSPPESADQCSEPGCNLPAKTAFESRNVCLAHFFAVCYQKLDQIGKDTRNWSHGGTKWEIARRVTKECAEKTTDLSQHQSELSNLERARLLDIALWAAELGRQLRRSKRNPMSIAVRLVSENPAHPWSEETHTVNVSTHGSQILCKHAVELGDTLKVFRLDKDEQSEVRVVWKSRTDSLTKEIGVEVVGDKTFWLP